MGSWGPVRDGMSMGWQGTRTSFFSELYTGSHSVAADCLAPTTRRAPALPRDGSWPALGLRQLPELTSSTKLSMRLLFLEDKAAIPSPEARR